MRFPNFLSISVIVCSFFSTHAQNHQLDSIPLNPEIRFGVLSNGLKYYILKTTGNRIRMHLSVNVGLPDEDADQLNMSHLVEHLALRSTKNFPMGIAKYFKGLPADVIINAMTNSTTDYYIEMPSDKPELVSKGLLALHDCAGSISFLPAEIEEERYAVYREANMGKSNASIANLDLQYRQLDEHPRYKLDQFAFAQSALTTPTENLKRFYTDWYHPAYQTVIVVGDVNEQEVEKQVHSFFADLTNENLRVKKDVRKLYDVQLSGRNRLLIAGGGSTSGIKIEVLKKQKPLVNDYCPATKDEYRVRLMYNMVNEMLSRRVNSTHSASKGPSVSIEQTVINGNAGISAFVAKMAVEEVRDVESAIRGIFTEMERLRRYGFYESEFILARKILISATVSSDGFMNSYFALLKYIQCGEAFPQNMGELERQLYSEIDLKEINHMVTKWLSAKGNTDIIFRANHADSLSLPSEQRVLSWMAEIAERRVPKYALPEEKKLPAISRGANLEDCAITELPEQGVTRILLPNGATVLLKTLSGGQIRNNEIFLRAIKLTNDPTLSDAKVAPLTQSIRAFIGLGALSTDDINEIIRDKAKMSPRFWISPYMRPDEVGITGRGDAESILELAYLYMMKAEKDEAAFDRHCNQLRSEMNRNKKKSLQDTIRSLMTGPLTQSISFTKADFHSVFELYKGHFSTPSQFTFIITGNFNKDAMLELVVRYLGALPKSHSVPVKNKKKNISINPEKYTWNFPREITLIEDSVANVNVCILVRGKCESNERNNIVLEIMRRTMSSLLQARLREKEKGVYGVSVYIRKGSYTGEFYLVIEFETSPADVERLSISVMDQIVQMRDDKFENVAFPKAVTGIREEFLNDLTTPLFWLDFLTEGVRKGRFDHEGLDRAEVLQTLTPSDVANAIRNFIDIEKSVIVKQL